MALSPVVIGGSSSGGLLAVVVSSEPIVVAVSTAAGITISQEVRNGLIGLTENAHQWILQCAVMFRIVKGSGLATVSNAPCAADSVNVIIDALRELVIDNVVDVGDVCEREIN